MFNFSVIHIVGSILSSVILLLATLQGLLLCLQIALLRHHKTRHGLPFLPPLDTMKRYLLHCLQWGLGVLTITLASTLFIPHSQPQPFYQHKIYFSLGAWLLSALILYKHQVSGWRDVRAVALTCLSFTLLVLAYLYAKPLS